MRSLDNLLIVVLSLIFPIKVLINVVFYEVVNFLLYERHCWSRDKVKIAFIVEN